MQPNVLLSTDLPILTRHPLYLEGMAHANAGRWSQALAALQLLQDIYSEDKELKTLLGEVEQRATEARSPAQPFPTRRIIIGLLLAVILLLAAYGVTTRWLQPAPPQELSVPQPAGESLTAGNDSPAPSNLPPVEQVEKLAGMYDQAQALIGAGQWVEALEVLAELQRLDPHYPNLPGLMRLAQTGQALERQFQAAEASFAAEDWPGAIAQYEALQQANPAFQVDQVQARLFESHLQYGRWLLVKAGAERKGIKMAVAQFAAARELQPLDAEALNAWNRVKSYQAALETGDRAEKIRLLQAIYDQEPGYAGGAAAELLYATLLAQADAALASGDNPAALAAYRAAAGLQVADPSVAQQRLAELEE